MQNVTPRVLPHDEETERALLACVLLRPELLSRMEELIPTPQMFYLERHRRIWKAYLAIVKAGSTIDLRTVKAQLQEDGSWETIGGFSYMAGLDLDLPDLDNWELYAEIIRERYRRRLSFKLAQELSMAGDVEMDLDEILSRTRTGLDKIAELGPAVGSVETMEQILVAALPAAEGSAPPSLPNFCRELDRYLLLAPGLTLGAGRPSHGKSAFVLTVADYVAHTLGQRVLHFSLEMPGAEVASRLLCSRAGADGEGIDFESYTWGRLGSADRQSVLDQVELVADAGMWILDPSFGHTAASLVAAVRHAHAADSLGLVVVDYLGLLGGLGLSPSEIIVGLGEASRVLHLVGIELGIPILALHQLSRQILHRAGWNPNLGDLRDSGHLEQNAARVFFVSHPIQFAKDDAGVGEQIPDTIDPLEMIIHIRKVRGGPGFGDVSLYFDPSRMKIRGQETRRQDPQRQPKQESLGWKE